MRFIITLIWALLIGSAISYVLTSMAGDPFNFSHGLILGVIFAIAIFILAEGILKEDSKH